MMRQPESDVEYVGLPEHLRSGVRGWIEQGRRPGGFLSAILENNLTLAALRAAPDVAPRLSDIVRWLYNEAPGPCWGSREKVAAWEARFASDQRPLFASTGAMA